MKTMKYFSATWCGPCQTFKPIMKELVSEGYNIEFIDVDEQGEQAAEFGIRSVPTTVIIENGKEVDRLIGAQTKSKVVEVLS
jgi:thioredoxin 1|tara:strand:+ start:136 stop:381 length:246 start_codon:yes stop_codon:yes gene_type:complete